MTTAVRINKRGNEDERNFSVRAQARIFKAGDCAQEWVDSEQGGVHGGGSTHPEH